MAEFLILDSGPVGDLAGDPTSPRVIAATDRVRRAQGWADIVLPEIADYEVRRELARRRAGRSLVRLDFLKTLFQYDPITTAIMQQAADYWGRLRRGGRPTADRHALDADVILAAHATLIARPGDRVAVVTTNPNHLARLVDVRDWDSLA